MREQVKNIVLAACCEYSEQLFKSYYSKATRQYPGAHRLWKAHLIAEMIILNTKK